MREIAVEIAGGMCAAERELRRDVQPEVPFDLVVALNDSDDWGRPVRHPEAERRHDVAKAAQKAAGMSGVRPAAARALVDANRDWVIGKHGDGWSRSRIIKSLVKGMSLPDVPGRTQLYQALAGVIGSE